MLSSDDFRWSRCLNRSRCGHGVTEQLFHEHMFGRNERATARATARGRAGSGSKGRITARRPMRSFILLRTRTSRDLNHKLATDICSRCNGPDALVLQLRCCRQRCGHALCVMSCLIEDCNEDCIVGRHVLHITTAMCGRIQLQLHQRCAASR